MKTVILDGHTINPGDLSWDALKEFGSLEVYPRTKEKDVLARINGSHILLTSKVNITKSLIEANPSLKMIVVLATGYNNVDVAFAKSKGILVTNIPAYSTNIVAQHTIALLLALCGLHEPPVLLSGKTLGVIGFGNISKRVISIASSFGMKILIYSHYPDKDLESETLRFAQKNELYENSDVITLHCPLRKDNAGFINRDNISKMKDGVMIINTSRGGLINTNDLADAISIGKVSAAGLDVLPVEPPKVGNPLIGLENVLITPHIAWSGKETRERLINIAYENVKAFRYGKPINVV